MKIRALIVEDESLIRWSIRQKLEERGFSVHEAESGKAADAAFQAGDFDLVLLDYRLPDTTGLELLQRLRAAASEAVVVMMTAYSTIDTAVEAIKLGAFDYLSKPFEMDRLLLTVDKALETTRLRREVRALRASLGEKYGADAFVGRHERIEKLLDTVRQIGRTGASTVLLRGETGTGKDLVARMIHHQSPRAARPFINITCTAISETLLESELFGHERGAFTDAKAQKSGLFELAHEGTIFLDEIGDMPPALQAKLLRFLEEHRFRRVGGTRELSVDVRVIAATNRDIDAAVRDGRFREDLYYRLNVVALHLPPLRERGDDVLLLTRYFVERYAAEFKQPVRGVSDAALDRIRGYAWPGNVRELRNAVERAVLLCRGDTIQADDLVLGRAAAPSADPLSLANVQLPPNGLDIELLSEIEKRLLQQAMARANDNQSLAAKLLNISRDRLRYRLQKHGLL